MVHGHLPEGNITKNAGFWSDEAALQPFFLELVLGQAYNTKREQSKVRQRMRDSLKRAKVKAEFSNSLESVCS